MSKLNLLFTKDGLQYQFSGGKVSSFFKEEDSPENYISESLDKILANKISEIAVISALNHFTLTSDKFVNHDLGYELIGFNAPVDEANEELMLSINKKYQLQFYYTFPKLYYQKLKSLNVPVRFNFSGEKFLNTLKSSHSQEMHIHLYHHQCEFIALRDNKVLLYNNLDARSEVDFLYFVMFTLSKINFNIADTRFCIYGEVKENQTFVNELAKFVGELNIIKENSDAQHFIFN